ncbi:hypothetical protein CCACVL1_30758 [Corchorus capsularis]|uniref:Uncharacterized protein n=1 Tax=Corchorus capsularis TaxID=210143 RepID=A0A1R3FVN3_COCAP|nr:hypothetical protein CCACVL1_30758 [Corchorus capsularis]
MDIAMEQRDEEDGFMSGIEFEK